MAMRDSGGLWTVYLFSDRGTVLFEKTFPARSYRDAEREGLRHVKPHLDRHPDAEDWVVEEASSAQRVAHRYLEQRS